MKSFIFLFPAILLWASNPVQKPVSSICLRAEEKKLYDVLMAYRQEKKLPRIALSAKLTQVAQLHAKDLAEHHEAFDKTCNMHSWSSNGNWTPCCYTNDHKEAACMWEKPREIAGYESNGFEISVYSGAGVTAEQALESWKSSSGHNQVIINESIWKSLSWKAIGIGIYEDYGVVWFGQINDEQTVQPCD